MNKYGFKEPVVDETHWMLGKIKGTPINTTGQYGDFLPVVEYQYKKFETSSCTGFGTSNAVEALMKYLYGIELNFSDRGLGIFAGTDIRGNDPHTVAEAWRENGLFQEPLLPFSDDLQNVEEYYSWKGGDEKMCRDVAKEWNEYFIFNHEWVFTKAGDTQKAMMEALTFSPLGVSVDAWRKEGEYYVKPTAGGSNHWCMCYGYKEGEYWLIFDSYDATTKKLAWDYKFDFCKRYSITKVTPVQPEEPETVEKPEEIEEPEDELQTLIARIMEWITKVFRGIRNLLIT